MAEQSWRWITEPIDGNPDNCRNVLVQGLGMMPGPRVILECANIDAEDRDKIAAVPELIAALYSIVRMLIATDCHSEEVDDGLAALAKARGEEVPDGG